MRVEAYNTDPVSAEIWSLWSILTRDYSHIRLHSQRGLYFLLIRGFWVCCSKVVIGTLAVLDGLTIFSVRDSVSVTRHIVTRG
jgi:hypothetical protein